MGDVPERVLIAGGGTGGHLFPGIALADELRRRGVREVMFVGSRRGIEREAVPRAGYPVELLDVGGVRGQGALGAAAALARVVPALGRSVRIRRAFRPELAVGVGGYAAFPAIVAARLGRVPVVLMEQNAAPGWVTRGLAPLAQRVCVSFPGTVTTLGTRAVLTGNPVRWSLVPSAVERRAAIALRLLVFGGSAGARRLNDIVPGAVARARLSIEVLHQGGAADCERVSRHYRDAGVEARVTPFIDDMAEAYAWADLVVCRAGATTLAELTALGVAALLVPYPHAAGDHQRINAEALVAAGAARMILDPELDESGLARQLVELVTQPAQLAAMRVQARALGRPDAAARVADECLAVVAARRGHGRR